MTATVSRTDLVPSPLRGTSVKMTRLRKVIAKHMIESLQTSAQLTTVIEVDVTGVAALRTAHKDAFLDRENTKLSFLPFFVKAAVEGLQVFPLVNSTFDSEGGVINYPDRENIGIAVDTDKGLFVPVLHDAGSMSLGELARGIDDLAARTRAGTISPDELTGGTFTITNTGSRGALFDTPIINQPQSAILGTGAVARRPAAVRASDGSEVVEVRSIAYLALSYDHRIVDGADAARYLSWVKERLEDADFTDELAG